MRFLIDTQVFIWLTNNDKRLGTEAKRLVSSTENCICISYFSFLEMVIKASIGKLHFDDSVLDDLPKMGIELLMPDTLTLRNYAIYNPHNKDPFDNILITVACTENCTLVTSDPKILNTRTKNLKLLDATQ